jgi:nucleoside-diphosphate-sugar epimerase
VPDPIHVIGASGRSGAALCRALLAAGREFVPVVRDAGRWRALGLPAAPCVADAGDRASLVACLSAARRVVSFAHASHSANVVAAAPADCRFVLLGSTRRYTRWPDEHGNGVIAGETAFLASGRNGVMLHPTMIYGAGHDEAVARLAAMLRRMRIAPLPGGGRALVQPIHEDDLIRCVMAALERDWVGPQTLVVAGPEPVRYADFVRAVARAGGLPRPLLLPVPAAVLIALAPLTAWLPLLPRLHPDEVRRLLEDRAFPVDAMVDGLGVRPMGLAQGLALTFAPR